MRRFLVPILIVAPLAAQEAKPAAAAAEQRISGSIEFGYRARTQVGGSTDAYRSVVDLGEGPKLFGVDLAIQNPSGRLFDRIDLVGTGWGGDPYSTARVDVRRSGAYRFSADYRNLAYFNFLPSFANPALALGSLLNQRAFDTHRRYTDLQLDLVPGRRISPFLAFTRDLGFGTGITTFVASGNEYPVANRLDDKTDHYRGGVHIQLKRLHVTLEQGGTTFRDNQSVFNATPNFGNRTTPLLDRKLVLNALDQAYGVEGDSIYSKGLFSAAPASWVDVHAQFLYSRPRSDVHYSHNAGGLFALAGTTRFFTGQQDTLFASAKQPHSSGSLGLQLRPFSRLRIIESWTTDRFHNASSAVLAEQLLFTGATPQALSALAADRLVYNYNRQQVDILFDVTRRLTLRGGHRYVWGDAEVRAPVLSFTPGLNGGELREHVGLAGLNYRAGQKLSVNVDFEGSSADASYFRISLHNYRRLRTRADYQVTGALALGWHSSFLDNENPTRGIEYKSRSRSDTFLLRLAPGGGKRVSLLGEYTRASLRSDISYLTPQDLGTARSLYRDNAHVASALLDFNLPKVQGATPRISFGGALFRSSGSRPTNYYQPVGRAQLPLVKHVQWFGEWRWYGYTEPFYLYEGFRTHLFLTGLRLTL